MQANEVKRGVRVRSIDTGRTGTIETGKIHRGWSAGSAEFVNVRWDSRFKNAVGATSLKRIEIIEERPTPGRSGR